MNRPIIRMASLAAASVLLGLGGCATPPAPPAPPQPVVTCAPGETDTRIAQLFFGRNIGKTPGVSETDWDGFLESEVMPRFPEGLSVIDTAGVWRGPDGVAVHELGKAVVIVLSGKGDEASRLEAVRTAYKTRFSQDSVLIAKSRSCVAF